MAETASGPLSQFRDSKQEEAHYSSLFKVSIISHDAKDNIFKPISKHLPSFIFQ